MEHHLGRLVDHVHLLVRDLDASRRFYEAVLGALGRPLGGSDDDHFQVFEALHGSRKGLSARRPAQQPLESGPEEQPEDREHQYRAAEARYQFRDHLS